MQISSRMLFKTAIVLLGLLLAAMVIVVAINANNQASAVSQTDWQTIAGHLDSAVSSQYTAGGDGESGFLITAQQLKPRIDSLGNNTFVGENSDMTNEPILVDDFASGTWIPATAERIPAQASGHNAWYSGADSVNAPLVANAVAAHRAAGLSTDIVVYCISGTTESPVVMAYAAMAQAGYFGTPAPHVYALKWGRYGWGTNGGTAFYGNALDTSISSVTPSAHTLATNAAACSGADPGLTQCAANAGLTSLGTASWGSLGAGVASADGGSNPLTAGDSTKQIIDLRPTGQASYFGNGSAPTPAGGAYATDVPLQTLFNSANNYQNLSYLDTTKTIIFANDTQHTAGMAALGARMLGYPATWLRWGLPSWNNAAGWTEKYPGTSAGYPYSSVAPNTTGPSLSGISTGTPGQTSAIITWNTNVVATSTVNYGTTASYGSNNNSDSYHGVLHAAHSVTLTGLTPGTTYHYSVTSFNGTAGISNSTDATFTTAADTPPIVTVPPNMTVEATSPAGAVVTFTATASDPDGDTVGPVTCAPASGSTFPLGTTAVSCSATDSNGNTGTASFSVTVQDTTPPVVNYLGPTGTVNVNNPTITGTAFDSGSGLASVSLSLNGGSPTACTVDVSGNVTCPTSGLADGSYTAVITGTDNAGNSSSGSGQFTINTCTGGQPGLAPAPPVASWGSLADYNAGLLTVTFTLNNSVNDAYNVQITAVSSTNGVTLATALPYSVGNIAAGSSASFSLQYNVPSGVRLFHTTLSASAADVCGTTYTYGAPPVV